MKLYNKQKKFEIKHFTKAFLTYHKPFYSNGTFIFNEKYLKVANGLPGFDSADRWRLLGGVFYDTDTSDLHNIVSALVPKNPDDDKLISCYMEPVLRGKNNFRLICQQFSFEVDGEKRVRYVDVDFLQYINIKNCYFRTTAEPISSLIIYDINTSEFVGLIMPIT